MNSNDKLLSLDPLFSTIITLYTLFLLYFPSSLFPRIVNLSPVLIPTIVVLLVLLRFGTTQSSTAPTAPESDPPESNSTEPDPKSSSSCYSFVEWDVRAPLEVIYEESDGHDLGFEENREYQMSVIQRYASLSMFYPESDSESSEEDFPAENMSFGWEEEEEEECGAEGLIEIELDGGGDGDGGKGRRSREVEEENMIEIDLSPVR